VIYSPAVLPMHVLLLHGMNTTPYSSWNDPSWSISTEWWIYLVFPSLVRPLRDAGPLRVSLIAATCFATYFAIMFYLVPRVTVPPAMAYDPVGQARHTIGVSYQYGFARCAAGFVLGTLAHGAYRAGRWQRWLAGGPALLVLATGAAISMHYGLPDPVTVAFFPLLVLSAACGGKGVDAVLGARPLRRSASGRTPST
jgi:peptidoglycan/LPS O-acetylase OafA/YrhL